MTIRLLLLLTCFLHTAIACEAKVKVRVAKSFVYRYYLRDKQGCGFSLDHPARFLSVKAIERRKRQRLRADSTDLPVSRRYVDLLRTPDTEVLGTSRWNNTVVVRSADSLLLERLGRQPFVREARMVWHSPDSLPKAGDEDVKWTVRKSFQKWDSVKNDPYGMSRPQVEMLGGDRLHEIGLRGEGMTIAVLDGGFLNVHRIGCLSGVHIAGVKDFVEPWRTPDDAADWSGQQPVRQTEAFFEGMDHGTRVLSVLAADAPEVMMGTAPKASYWLLRCEDPATEQPVEEDYWAMAAEYADSVGADVISSSLGYNEYDKHLGSYRLKDLDGQTALISRTASMLARKGMVLCNSAGNSGMSTWKKIGVPADAHDILTVGAINKDGRIAAFSSVGPSQDLRVKPDVVAIGAPAALVNGKGMLAHDMGTSFSTPVVAGLVACLWQGLRQKTALEIIELVRHTARQYESPDNVYGYGTPDFWQAYMAGQNK